jgi:hypothetical protein
MTSKAIGERINMKTLPYRHDNKTDLIQCAWSQGVCDLQALRISRVMQVVVVVVVIAAA